MNETRIERRNGMSMPVRVRLLEQDTDTHEARMDTFEEAVGDKLDSLGRRMTLLTGIGTSIVLLLIAALASLAFR